MSRARRAAALLAASGLLAAAGRAAEGSSPARDPRPNVVIVLTDDQPWWTIPHDPPPMPWLQARLEDPADHWVRFPLAFVNVPLCCPSRASLLTGRYAHRTGVLTNRDGARLDERDTIAVRLRDAGYHTGYVGKYLNGYPFGRGPYVPPGWDRWTAKWQGSGATVYLDHVLIEDGLAVRHGSSPGDYLTDVLASRAVRFVREAPRDRPFLLVFAPTAPHAPWMPAPRHEGTFLAADFPDPPSFDLADVGDGPGWVRALPRLPDPGGLRAVRRDAAEALLAVDEAVRAIVEALRARGDLERTAIFVLTDNGAAFGEHRWVGKGCPYDECARIPFLVRLPGARPGARPDLASVVDVAPTVAELAGVPLPGADGRSLLPALEGRPAPPRPGVLLEWAGDPTIPAWWAVRTPSSLYVEYATGERERYDLRRDPWALRNLAGRDPAADRSLAALLRSLRG
ncbi:MAG TPA: sulfatase [Actinomycetota bacterium]|nr:sulfatase [Actinomycetota bacterium]